MDNRIQDNFQLSRKPSFCIHERIKFLRKGKGLRQWQMAQMLGATQPAIHKYENGILPEVKRLLEIARIGNTSIEWILTGRHWENGSTQIDRLAAEVYELAYQLQSLQPADRRILAGSLNILQAAISALKTRESLESDEPRDAGPAFLADAMASPNSPRAKQDLRSTSRQPARLEV